MRKIYFTKQNIVKKLNSPLIKGSKCYAKNSIENFYTRNQPETCPELSGLKPETLLKLCDVPIMVAALH